MFEILAKDLIKFLKTNIFQDFIFMLKPIDS